mmetsp:Transcript_37513/g.115191  ORF Transcript_37513/g.115191 Transcript_37513/m.115191 type:complete len:285 (+) Transcript_37513:567-1421(+)
MEGSGWSSSQRPCSSKARSTKAGRSSGARAKHASASRAMAGGQEGCSSSMRELGRRFPVVTACIRFSGEMPPRFSSAKKGGCPVAMWTSSPPKDHTSHGLPYRSCRSTSGAMYTGVPCIDMVIAALEKPPAEAPPMRRRGRRGDGVWRREVPKSLTLADMAGSLSSTLPGLRSRWITRWLCRYAMPRATSVATLRYGAVHEAGTPVAPFAWLMKSSSARSISSVRMPWLRSPSETSPRVRRTFGWRSLRARRHSSTSTCIARLAASLLKRNRLHATPVEAYTAW